MIDFRYHLVSLAALLIALSIGIVLGAGPLNDNIGNTLSGEVTKLRQEKDALRQDANDQRRQIEGRDAYDEESLAKVVGGQLTDRRVAVVVLPEAPAEDVKAVRETLQESGAMVNDNVDVTADWAETGDAATSDRQEIGASALRDLGADPAVPDGAQQVDQALAIILTGHASPADTTSISASARTKAWTDLRDGGLVDGQDAVPAPADAVVVLGAPVPSDAPDGSESVDQSAERTAGAWVALTHLIQTRAGGTVLAAAEADDGTRDASPVTMARTQGSLADGVSTVDVPSIPMGRAAIVLALVQQLDGDAGHYGLGESADGPVPTQK